MVQAARRNLARDGRHFTFSVADAQAIPFKAACFDAIIAYGVFDHVPHRQQTFAEILRVLKPGGRLYASAGGQTHLQQIEALVRPFVSEADYGGDPDRFGLENGLALLSPWFTAVRRLLYQDVLVFRQVEPIVAYVLSEAEVKCALVDDKLARFIAFVQREMARRGEIRVTVDKGIFAARKGSEEDEA
jgi:ubiquinone/menaquinone biosynthesis C-methylase UbiE